METKDNNVLDKGDDNYTPSLLDNVFARKYSYLSMRGFFGKGAQDTAKGIAPLLGFVAIVAMLVTFLALFLVFRPH
jgi:hypothetical protein